MANPATMSYGRARAEAELLNAIARTAAGEDDLGRILSGALDHLARLIPFTGGSIALVEGESLVIRAAIGPFTEVALGQRLPRGGGPSWRVVETGKAQLYNDLAAAGVRTKSTTPDKAMRSWLAVPLVWHGRAFGLLEIDSTAPDAFSPADLSLMQAVAALVSGPIELARRYADQVQARRQVEELAAERATMLHQIVDGVIIADPQGHITFANEAARRLHGRIEVGAAIDDPRAAYELLTLEGQPYPPQELPLARAIQRGETIASAEWRIRRPDGSEVIAQGSATPVLADDGRQLGAVLVLRDVTEQRALERQKDELLAARDRALAEAEEAQRRLTFLAEASALLSTSLDYEATLARMAHLAVPSLADWCTVDIIADDGSLQRLAVAHVDPAKVTWAYELQRRYPPDMNASYGVPHVMRTGKPELYPDIPPALLDRVARDAEHLAILRDLGLRSAITAPLIARERTLGAITFVTAESGRRYDHDALALVEELARRAAVAIDNARLYHEAQEAIRARDQFLSIASHELKTPLTSLLGYAELMERRAQREGTLVARDQRALRVIVEQSARLYRMVAALLDLSRIETGQLSIERASLDLGALAQRLVDEMQPTLDRHTIHYQGPASPLLIMGDELRLEQVLQNLISNAVKYSPAGGVVELQIERDDSWAHVVVRDEGIGIPHEALPRLFQRFYRAQNAEARQIAGMGVGLYVVKEIVALHGGEVEVTSEEGRGSTFVVRLPIVER